MLMMLVARRDHGVRIVMFREQIPRNQDACWHAGCSVGQALKHFVMEKHKHVHVSSEHLKNHAFSSNNSSTNNSNKNSRISVCSSNSNSNIHDNNNKMSDRPHTT